MRHTPGGFDGASRDAIDVAISWVAVNTPHLLSLGTGRVDSRRLLYSAHQDIVVSTEDTAVPKLGSSLGGSVAIAVLARLINQPDPGSLVAVSAELDLRGRLWRVGCLDKKAAVSRENGVEMVVVSGEDMRWLEATGFSEIPEGDVRDYAMAIFKGADTVLDAIKLIFPGQSVGVVLPAVA